MHTNMFNPPITAQFIRIYPVMCRRACTLRFELIGCEMNGKCPLPGGCRAGGDTGQGITPWPASDPSGQGICQCLFFLTLMPGNAQGCVWGAQAVNPIGSASFSCILTLLTPSQASFYCAPSLSEL